MTAVSGRSRPAKPGKDVDYGVVSDGHGFEDSPDCERISGGKNSKGPYAVAIGRQANMLQWGFYAAPDRMTESGKRAFLNAIVYMQQFDGRQPLVEKVSRGRGWYKQYVEAVAKMTEETSQSYRDYLIGRFPKDVIEEHGTDAAKLEAWRVANVEYLYSKERYELAIDPVLQKLGLSNRKPEFLDYLVKTLGTNPNDEQALLLANRYLGDEHGANAAAAIAFITRERSRLFFSDQGGYRWFVNTLEPRSGAAKTILRRKR